MMDRVVRVKTLVTFSALLFGTFTDNEMALNWDSWVFEEDTKWETKLFS